jgi:apoptosis-inducing factor 2
MNYRRLLDRGRVIHDRAVRVGTHSVELGSGKRIAADYIVLATGSQQPFPANVDLGDAAAAAARIRATHETLARSRRVLLLGASPTGLELAGAVKSAWPDKAVTVIDPAPELRAEVREQLVALGVELILGTSLFGEPASEPGEAGSFTAITCWGTQITADIWFRCSGATPLSGFLAGELVSARRRSGHVEVTAELRVAGQHHVFAIGDLTAIAEAKTAKAAGEHAEVVAQNIRTLIQGGAELVAYRPAPPGISRPLDFHTRSFDSLV